MAEEGVAGLERSTEAGDPGEVTPTAEAWPDFVKMAVAAGLTVILFFLLWQGLEEGLVRDDATAHRLHYARGVSTSLVTALVVGWVAHLQARRRAVRLREDLARSTREAEDAQAFLRVIIDNTPASLLVLDRDLNVVQANRVAEWVHGRSAVGVHCFELLKGSSRRCPECPAWDALKAGRIDALPCPHTDPRTGEMLAVESHPLRLPGGRDYVLLVERVITEQKKLQARLLHQEKMAAFGLLAAGIAHEMGNPLASVEAQLQLLDLGTLPLDARTPLGVVSQEVQRLRRILRELVDFARRRRDEDSLVSPQAVFSDALRLLRHDPRMRNVRAVEEFDPETPPVFMVEDHLIQVALNLLINALDAMPDGGTVRIEIGPLGDQVVFRVHDTGVGMDRVTLARCFEPLFTTKAPGKGTGLGLSMSRDIVAAAGGGIELHSAPGRGTTVVMTLPAALVDERTARTPQEAQRSAGGGM